MHFGAPFAQGFWFLRRLLARTHLGNRRSEMVRSSRAAGWKWASSSGRISFRPSCSSFRFRWREASRAPPAVPASAAARAIRAVQYHSIVEPPRNQGRVIDFPPLRGGDRTIQ